MIPPIDAHVRLDTHPTHPSAVQAVLTGTQARVALLALEAAGWTVAATNVLVLSRIDHEEPYWANDAAKHLTAEGIPVEITPQLQEAIDEEWTWPNHPMSWCTRSEIREISNQAQKIHDDIRHGRLLIYAHAHDGHTTVAVGTYLSPGGESVHLHGQDHLRQISDTFNSPAEALTAFQRVHAAAMRPGPAPLTTAERAAIAARSVFDVTTAKSGTPASEPEPVPIYLADAGDHDALLDSFLDEHGEFEKWRTWSDDTTHAIHESQTLRIERVHETQARETAWTVAAYETPVSDRMWHLTATSDTPAPVLQNLLIHLSDGDGWDTATGTQVDEKTVTATTQPLTEAGWKHAWTGHGIRWMSPDGKAGMQFHPLTPQHAQNPATWTIWGGTDPDRPKWTLTASPHTPSSLLAGLAAALAQETGTRQVQPSREHGTRLTASAPATPTVPAGRPANRSR
ncbi:DUF317 domain-containing protein [Streptomyces sp. NPDC058459]|uniref:DUF317 domain-containing protein n=1 Tax=Streptomyces sp. NPDC058459 TaxID=3346508 RepID=UPI0036573F9A